MADETIENAASNSETETAENSQEATAGENKNTPPDNGVPNRTAQDDDLDAMVALVDERIAAVLADPTVNDALAAAVATITAAAAEQAFQRILSDPAVIEEARLAAIAANEKQLADAEAERAALAEEEAAQREAAEKEAAAAKAEAIKQAVKDRTAASKAKVPTASKIDWPADVGTGGARIEFGDGKTFLPGFGRTIDAGDIAIRGNLFVVSRAIEFDGSGDPATATEAWLVARDAKDKLRAVCIDLGGGLALGDGRKAAIPGNSLAF